MNNRLRNAEAGVSPSLTINDIARELGLSKTTISRVISGTGRIGADTRERVLAYIKDCGFQPNHIAKSLAVSKTFNIAVTLPADAQISEIPFFQTCLHSITETVNARDYDVVISDTNGQDIKGLKRLVRNHKIDGAILTRLLSEDRSVDFLRDAGIPFVVIGSKNDTSLVQVDSDHFNGCREITAHVLGQGSRRLALVAGNPEHQVNADRYSGYLAALKAAGIAPEAAPVLWNSDSGVSIDRAMEAAMRGKPDCLICMDDAICGRALSWLQRKGYGIPCDIRVASFHDSAFMEMHNPPVTALHIHVSELGAVAGKVLLDMIAGKPVSAINRVGYELAERDSSRPL
jgi:DNA-binding LacI/PurR family transcriptional regulator